MLGSSIAQPIFTYVLISTETEQPIYIGKGTWERGYKHRQQNSPIGAHVRELASRGYTARVERLPAKDADEAFEMEEPLVAMIGRQEDGTGPLFNVRPGGRTFAQAASTKAKLSKSHMGKKLSDEHKASISRTLKGRPQMVDPKVHSARMKEWWRMRKSMNSVEK